MYKTVIIDKRSIERQALATLIGRFCPSLKLNGIGETEEACFRLLEDTNNEIAFINPALITPAKLGVVKNLVNSKAIICFSESLQDAKIATNWRAAGLLSHPFGPEELVRAADAARELIQRIRDQKNKEQLFDQVLSAKGRSQLIGIPTIEGYEILHADKVIRLEGLQKCTRIVTTYKNDIISSYNIGEFKKLMKQLDQFYCPHRSHIINLLYVIKYKKAGIIVLQDGAHVPIAKIKKPDFLQQIKCL